MSDNSSNFPSTYRIYVVFQGWVPGIYMTMEEVRFQIREHEGATWGHYNSLDEAEEAYLNFLGRGQRNVGIELINSGEAPEPVETDDHRQRQRTAILALHQRYHHEAGLPLPHSLSASIVPPDSCDAMVQRGRYSFNTESSKEDAARLCLRTLSRNLQRPVYDYNFDLLNSTQQTNNRLQEDSEAVETVFDLDNIPHNATGSTSTRTTRRRG
ncbi:hypothetical protein PIB30_088721 [Stylosanthes scabra]|uniref:Ribonuclease H1 N-terminal domain-containing protein n=1 Tax=Stylosanthes scabra TaxID=79078 RepID=A0ABU6QV60_9FABA|nr:hypothetical protein [Stylosanthes scabra]